MNDTLLWYTARGAGAVSLALLSAVTVLGLLTRARVESPGWPRLLTAALHRDLALLSVVFLALHIVTAVVDPFTHLGFLPVVVPFATAYRPFWLGLGTVALLLLVAILLTSLVRDRIGATAWRAVHLSAYAAWPIAVVHGLGTGTDAWSVWMLPLTVLCVVAVGAAAVWRITAPAAPLTDERRRARRRHAAPAGVAGGRR